MYRYPGGQLEDPLAWIFAQVSLSVMVRLKTGCPGARVGGGRYGPTEVAS